MTESTSDTETSMEKDPLYEAIHEDLYPEDLCEGEYEHLDQHDKFLEERDEKIMKMIEDETVDVSFIDYDGTTILMALCKMKLKRSAMRLLELRPDECQLEKLGEYDVSALSCSLYSQLHDVALKIVKEHPHNCQLGKFDCHYNTPLQMAVGNGAWDVAMEMLKYPEECNIGAHLQNGSNTILIDCAYDNGFNEALAHAVALKILDYPELCKMDYADQADGETALMAHCAMDNVDIVKKMLERPDLCNLMAVDEEGDTAFHIAAKSSDPEMKKLAEYMGQEMERMRIMEECNIRVESI